MSLYIGRSSQILDLRQYNSYVYRIKEEHNESALAKFHAFILTRFWDIIPQMSTHFGVLRSLQNAVFSG